MERNGKRRCWTMAALVIAAAGVAGCMSNPVAPVVSPASGDPASVSSEPLVLTVSPGNLAAFAPVPPESTTDTQVTLLNQDLAVAVATEVPSALLVRATIDGAVGGTVRCGRFRLDFPRGAFAGTATIQMAAPDSTVMLCDLSISPVELNYFKKPVVLTLDAGNLTVSADALSIYWYDPMTGLWVDMRSTRDLATGQVSQKLTHFSRYLGGKAGW